MAAGCIGGATTQNITQAGDVLILRKVHRVILGLLGCIMTALADLGGKLSPSDIRKLNYAVDAQHQDAAVVVRSFREAKGL